MKLSDYIVAFLEKKGIYDFFGYQGTMIAHLVDSIEKIPIQTTTPAIMSRVRHLQPAVMLRQKKTAPVHMRPAVREL